MPIYLLLFYWASMEASSAEELRLAFAQTALIVQAPKTCQNAAWPQADLPQFAHANNEQLLSMTSRCGNLTLQPLNCFQWSGKINGLSSTCKSGMGVV